MAGIRKINDMEQVDSYQPAPQRMRIIDSSDLHMNMRRTLGRIRRMDLNNENAILSIQQAEKQVKTYIVDAVVPAGGMCYRLIKQVFDVVFSMVFGIITSPIMLVVALLIKCDSPGKVIFAQERVGKDGKRFKMLKFRTMVENAEQGAPVWAEDDDPRYTRIGKKLRQYRLDELPQVLNILMGHMSVVGPRPERLYFYDSFEKYIHGFRNRLAVKPGLTGLAQISGGYDLKPEEKILYDMAYIKSRTIWLDFKIILKTIKVILKKEGAK